MRKVLPIAAGLSAVVLLAGCGHRGYGRSGPDEFAVARQAPLVIPPDFSLVPPAPGAARANDTNLQAQALDALFGGPAQRSGGERAVLSEAGDASADAGIRSSVGDPKTNVVDKGQTTRDVIAAPEGDGQTARAATTGK
ncbi:MAG: DUF3035 domain-containing protein [Sphingomonas sp.]